MPSDALCFMLAHEGPGLYMPSDDPHFMLAQEGDVHYSATWPSRIIMPFFHVFSSVSSVCVCVCDIGDKLAIIQSFVR